MNASECAVIGHVPDEDILQSPEVLAVEWFNQLECVTGIKKRNRERDCLRWCVQGGVLVSGVDGQLIMSKSKGVAEISFARQIICYLLSTLMNINMSVIGRLMGRDRSTVSYAVMTIEDLRDSDPQLEQEFDRIYSAIILAIGDPIEPDGEQEHVDGRSHMKRFA